MTMCDMFWDFTIYLILVNLKHDHSPIEFHSGFGSPRWHPMLPAMRQRIFLDYSAVQFESLNVIAFSVLKFGTFAHCISRWIWEFALACNLGSLECFWVLSGHLLNSSHATIQERPSPVWLDWGGFLDSRVRVPCALGEFEARTMTHRISRWVWEVALKSDVASSAATQFWHYWIPIG